MSALVRVVGPCSGTHPACLVLNIDKLNILINCSDGIQRVFNEQRLKFAKLDSILFTRVQAETVSGLCGLLLSTNPDNFKHSYVGEDLDEPPSVIKSLMGPTGLRKYINSLKPFYQNLKQKPEVLELDRRSSFEKERIDFFANISPYYSMSRHIQITWSVDPIAIGGNGPANGTNTAQNFKEKNATTEQSFLSYIVTTAKTRSTFLPEKARSLGLKNKDFKTIIREGKVVLDGGKVVHIEECSAEKEPAQLFLVLDTDSQNISSLAQSLKEKQMFQPAADKKLSIVFHFPTKEVVSEEKYFESIIRPLNEVWGNDLEHVFCGYGFDFRDNVFLHQDFILHEFHTINQNLFPLEGKVPEDVIAIQEQYRNSLPLKVTELQKKANLRMANTMDTFTLFPKRVRGWKNDLEKQLKLEGDDVFHINLPPNERAARKKRLPNPFDIKGDVRVSFLGTASMMPSKFRNVSSILFNFTRSGKSNQAVMLDCGEGTLYQLLKLLGQQGLDRLLVDELDSIYISHNHADHHLGLLNVLARRHECLQKLNLNPSDKKICLIGPPEINEFLKEMQQVDKRRFAYKFHFSKRLSSETLELEGYRVSTTAVKHSPSSYAVKLAIDGLKDEMQVNENGKRVRARDSFDLVYSGDTLPCAELVEFGSCCDVLIHEATFPPYLAREAVMRRHSTNQQAIKIGREMKAKRILLTHFSQRVPINPRVRVPANKDVIVARDFMCLDKEMLAQGPLFMDSLYEDQNCPEDILHS